MNMKNTLASVTPWEVIVDQNNGDVFAVQYEGKVLSRCKTVQLSTRIDPAADVETHLDITVRGPFKVSTMTEDDFVSTAPGISSPIVERVKQPWDDKAIEGMAIGAYHAYGATTDFKNYQGLPMPSWPELPPRIHDAWLSATRFVVDQVDDRWTSSTSSIVDSVEGDPLP